jgi:hypothetical protein
MDLPYSTDRFSCKSRGKIGLLRALRSMLESALDIIKNDLESGQLEKGPTWKA